LVFLFDVLVGKRLGAIKKRIESKSKLHETVLSIFRKNVLTLLPSLFFAFISTKDFFREKFPFSSVIARKEKGRKVGVKSRPTLQ
jgi:hypothetical protein